MNDKPTALARLANAAWLHRSDTQAVLTLLGGEEGECRAVGGSVRDSLLGLESCGDVDFATIFVPEEVMARAAAADIKAVPTGIDHGTVTLVLEGRGFEVTTLRRDVETDGRHAEVAFGTDWAVDAARRDFTCNALYADMDGGLFDPLGGIEDALAGRVRFIGDAAKRIEEDRLRVFRFFRFSASHGRQVFDAEGLAACAGAARHLGALSSERVGHEMVRMLGLPAIASTLRTMVDAGVMDLTPTCVDELTDYEARTAEAEVLGRLAVLFEHIKPSEIQARWRLSNGQVMGAEEVGAAAHLLSEGAVLEAAYRHGKMVERAVPVAGVLGDWDAKLQARVAAQVAGLHVPVFPISGRDLLALGVEQGPELGAALKLLETEWIASGFVLGRAELLARFKH